MVFHSIPWEDIPIPASAHPGHGAMATPGHGGHPRGLLPLGGAECRSERAPGA